MRAPITSRCPNMSTTVLFPVVRQSIFRLRKFDLAIEALGNAQTVRLRIKTNTLQEATYLWAKSLDELFRIKPTPKTRRPVSAHGSSFQRPSARDGATSAQCKARMKGFRTSRSENGRLRWILTQGRGMRYLYFFLECVLFTFVALFFFLFFPDTGTIPFSKSASKEE